MKVHSFESMAAVDGEGVRFCVFLAGCPIRCCYCHNPDTQSGQGTEFPPEVLAAKINRYKPYFSKKGGVTFSGGEPLLQADEIIRLNKYLEREGIKYAVDTSGCVKLTKAVKEVLLNAELVICDLKFPDADSFLKYTNGDFNLELETLKFVSENNIRLWVRTVIVPDINDSEEWIEKYVRIVAPLKAEKYELLAFHTMGFYKYTASGIYNPLEGYRGMSLHRLYELQKYADKLLNNR